MEQQVPLEQQDLSDLQGHLEKELLGQLDLLDLLVPQE